MTSYDLCRKDHGIIEQWPESFHRTKSAAGKLLNGKMLSLIAGKMNGERPNCFQDFQGTIPLCKVFVGHHLQVNVALIIKRLRGMERNKGKHIFPTYFIMHGVANGSKKWG